MRRPLPLTAPTGVALFTAFLLGCAAEYDPPTPRPPMPPRTVVAQPVDSVRIQVTGCNTDNIGIVVNPWVAHIRQDSSFRWVVEGDPGVVVRIRHKDGHWPFRQIDLPEGRPNTPIQAGRASGQPGDRGRYDIIVRCGGRTITIDPDHVIIDP